MGGHQSREGTNAARHANPALAVMVCLALVAAAAVRHRSGQTQRLARASENAAAGAFRAWDALRSVGAAEVTPDATDRWIACREGRTRLRVWSLDDDGALGEILLDSHEADFTLKHIAWAGSTLVYTGWKGQLDLHALDMFPPPEGVAEYLAARAFSAAWDPPTGTQTDGVPNGFWEALADPPRERLIVVDQLPELEHRRRGRGNYARILRVPGFRLERELEFHLDPDIEPEVGGDAWFLGWHPVEEGFYVVSECMAPLAPADQMKYPFPLLMFVDVHGRVRRLSDDKDPRLAQTWRYGVPAISLIENGAAVAGFVEHWQGGTGVAAYDLGGLRREYSFGVHDPFPPRLREVASWWRFIVCTRDGKRALFQEAPDPYHPKDGRAAPWWVYLWDLEKETYEPIAQMNKIEYCFGWLSDTALIVGAQAEDPEAAERELYDYGVLHLTKPVE